MSENYSEISSKELVFDGNEKQIFSTDDPEKVIIHFKDVATAFNSIKQAKFPGKGKVNNNISSLILDYLGKNGVYTHFISMLSETEQLCRKSRNIPLELIVRNLIAGTLADRLALEEGTEPATVIYDLTYNRDELGDPLINDSQAVALGIVSYEDLSQIYAIARRVNELLGGLCRRSGLKLVDFKLEFGRDSEGRIMICDEISPDTCRFWDAATGERLDKDRFRHDVGNIVASYCRVLDMLREGLGSIATGGGSSDGNVTDEGSADAAGVKEASASAVYQDAGVNLEAGYEVVRRIRQHVASTMRRGSMGDIGSFGGMFDLSALNIADPVLVSGTDGVGTKLKIAFAMDKHDTVGIDAVAMCVNDVLAQGAEPLIFLDYVAIGHNVPEKVEAIVAGVAEGCRQAGCALVGGETAEMPGMYADGEYDIAGYTTGVVSKARLIDGSKVKAGDVLVGIASSGVHSNGFSLVRKIVSDSGLSYTDEIEELGGRRLGDVLLTPTRIYVKPVLEVIRNCDVHGISHITGGGFDENIPRVLHEGQGLEIHEGSWEILPVFRFLEEKGGVPHREMFNIFNMGIGMVIVLDESEARKAMDILEAMGEKASLIGRVKSGSGVSIM